MKFSKIVFHLVVSFLCLHGSSRAEEEIPLPQGKYKYRLKLHDRTVKPGDTVDVFLREESPIGKKGKAGWVLENVLVVAVENEVHVNGQEPEWRVAAVAIAPKESLYLAAAERRGVVRLCPNRFD